MKLVIIYQAIILLFVNGCKRHNNKISTSKSKDDRIAEIKTVTPFEGEWRYDFVEFSDSGYVEELGAKVSLSIQGEEARLKFTKIKNNTDLSKLTLPLNEGDLFKDHIEYKGKVKKIRIIDHDEVEVPFDSGFECNPSRPFNGDCFAAIEGFPGRSRYFIRFAENASSKDDGEDLLLMGIQDPSWRFVKVSKSP